jgi:hypothetical protein
MIWLTWQKDSIPPKSKFFSKNQNFPALSFLQVYESLPNNLQTRHQGIYSPFVFSDFSQTSKLSKAE